MCSCLPFSTEYNLRVPGPQGAGAAPTLQWWIGRSPRLINDKTWGMFGRCAPRLVLRLQWACFGGLEGAEAY